MKLFLILSTSAMSQQQVHVITRHGAREVLPKTDRLHETHGPQLTDHGYAQAVAVGAWLRERYSLPLHLESSATERTLTTAMGVAEGYQQARTPVYSLPSSHDVYWRPHQQCPYFLSQLDKLYNSDEWKQLEQDQADVLNRHDTDLRHVWNVYDRMLVSNETSSDWDLIQALATQTELWRFGPESVPVVSNTLQKILDTTEDGLYVYTTHYSVLLSVLNALRWDPYEIPPYASALVLERVGDRFAVYYRRTTSDQLLGGNLVTLPCDDCIQPKLTLQDWCSYCRNDSADVCTTCSNGNPDMAISFGVALGVGAIMGLIGFVAGKRRQKVAATPQLEDKGGHFG